jgi:hypothetical protein
MAAAPQQVHRVRQASVEKDCKVIATRTRAPELIIQHSLWSTDCASWCARVSGADVGIGLRNLVQASTCRSQAEAATEPAPLRESSDFVEWLGFNSVPEAEAGASQAN